MTRYRFSLCVLLSCVILSVSFFVPARGSEAVFVLAHQTVLPLPGGCGGVTPGDTGPSCCMSGFVYGDGQPLSGAELTITAADGTSLETGTFVHSGDETRPYYYTKLSSAPLSIAPGESITVTARLGDHERSMRYVVQPGGQQLDLIFPSRHSPDYLFERHIGSSSSLSSPRGVAYDSQGNIYILDTSASHVRVFDSNGSLLHEWGSSGIQPGQLNQPGGIAIGPADRVYIADTMNHRVQIFKSNGSWITSLGEQGSAHGQLNYPQAVAIDPNGNIYVADTENNRIQKFNSNAIWLASWGSQGSAAGQFDGPTGIAVDQDGNIYIADQFNNRIQKLDSNGVVLTSWGGYGTAAAQFSEPRGIAVDRSGRVFVADSGNDRIQLFSATGSWLASWGASGIADGLFGTIYGIAITADGHVSVADASTKRIAVFRPMLETRPIATINHINSADLAADGNLFATGIGVDSDTNDPISAYQWLSDRQGILGETATLSYPASKLLPGEHQLRFMVRDAQGQWSELVQMQIFVEKGSYQLFLPAIIAK